MGTDATTGFVGVAGGVTRGGGAWVIGVTTFMGLWGLVETKDGDALIVAEGGGALLCFSSGVVLPGRGGGAVRGSEVRAEEAEDKEVILTSGLGFSSGSGGAGTVFTTATAGEAPPPAQQINTSVMSVSPIIF